jgi:hypothetical protein
MSWRLGSGRLVWGRVHRLSIPNTCCRAARVGGVESADDAGRVADCDDIRRQVADHDRAGPDNGVLADRHA